MTPDTFATARLVATRLQGAHYADLRVMHQDAEMMRYIGGLRDPESTQAYLDRHLAHWDAHQFGFYLLRTTTPQEWIGLAGLRTLDLDAVREVEVGYGFLPAHWGVGLGREITAALCDVAAQHLSATSVVALVDPDNTASLRLLRALDFVPEQLIERDGHPITVLRRTLTPQDPS